MLVVPEQIAAEDRQDRQREGTQPQQRDPANQQVGGGQREDRQPDGAGDRREPEQRTPPAAANHPSRSRPASRNSPPAVAAKYAVSAST
ncbi:hypothetical protein [Paractinoplanes durhamensis]|uniref:hypothetical protein n=1 Tax=Paractinoplanes durhamensis TaxID=113563 RepID=UPI003634D054